ncbi:MAG: Na+/H+ antiporter subunit G [Sulfurospirillaceae bacterium]|jgi:multicomponent K+:H+ antiporter subunit G|nr:Na+/H+ antiporter subunit G [Sulfurospirillaceae bacterium]MCK9546292.1 Na+/H+ antiporter subunit G [Sulfurospirillaceae bacterium]MDY0237488.1 Na+/H+ antiporter subunit G [Campylobacterales bacterium]
MDFIIAFFLLVGAFFVLVGSIGLVKLPDFFMRLHAPTKATTLGVGSILIASTLYYLAYKQTISLHEILIAVFFFITAPVSAHLMAKAAIHKKNQEELKKKN